MAPPGRSDCLLRLEVQLQLELGGTWSSEVVGSRTALHALTVLHSQVVRTVQEVVDRSNGPARIGNVRQCPTKGIEVAHVEDIVESNAGLQADPFMEPAQADRVGEVHVERPQRSIAQRRGGSSGNLLLDSVQSNKLLLGEQSRGESTPCRPAWLTCLGLHCSC